MEHKENSFLEREPVGKALASTMISLIREVVFGVGFALLLPLRFGLDGVLYSMPVSDALTFVVAALVIASTYRQLSAQDRPGKRAAKRPITGTV